MKINFKAKYLLPFALVGCLLIPTISLTSCSTISQYYYPVTIGNGISGSNLDPYKNFRDEVNNDINNQNINQYLPSNYIYTTDSSSGSITPYAYAQLDDTSTSAGGKQKDTQ